MTSVPLSGCRRARSTRSPRRSRTSGPARCPGGAARPARAAGQRARRGPERLDLLLRLVERLDGLPRHIALHPCGVLLSDRTLLDRTPVEASWLGFPMSQFDKDDVEDLGLLKLDVLGIRMQSAMAHAVEEVAPRRRRRASTSTRVDAATTRRPST